MAIGLLEDAFATHGTALADFTRVTTEMSEITKDIECRGGDLTFLSLCEREEAQKPGKVAFYILNEENIEAYLNENKFFPVGTVSVEKVGQALIDEMKNSSRLMLLIKNVPYLVSELALPTITIRALVGGQVTIERNNLIRDMHIADALICRNEYIRFVYREVSIGKDAAGNDIVVKKIFAAMGGMFRSVPQTILADSIDLIRSEGKMGKEKVHNWSVDQTFTSIYLEYDQVTEDIRQAYQLPDQIIPGVYLCTSDIGRSSIIGRGCYRRKGSNSYVVTDEVAFKHTGKACKEVVLKQLDNGVFAKLRKLPEALCNLIGKDVTDYTKLDLSTTEGQEENVRIMGEVYRTVIKKLLKEKVGAKNGEELAEQMASEINPSLHYTMYDVALAFMDIPDRVANTDRATDMEIRKICAKIPFEIEKIIDGMNKKLILKST